MRTNTRRRAKAGALALAAAAILASCGVGAGASGTDDLSEADKTRIAEDFRDCLAEFGIEGAVSFEGGATNVDIGSSDSDATDEELLAAEAECEALLEDIDGGQDFDPEEEARLIDAGPAIQKCLNDKGYVVQVDAQGGINFNSDDQTTEDFDESEYLDAEDACYKEVVPDLWEKFGEGN